MFETIHLTNLRHAEYIQFIRNFIEILDQKDLEVLQLKAKRDELNSLIDKMSLLYKPDRASSMTKILQDDDVRRDKALVGIQTAVTAFSYHFNVEFKDAAVILLNSLEKYGSGIAKQNYQAETATISAIIDEWKRETIYVEALNKLTLNDWVNELEVANTQFNTDYLGRVKEDAEAPEVKIIDLRKQINEAYQSLALRIGAFNTISDNQDYLLMLKQSNSLIEKYNAVLVARAAKSEKEELEVEE
jgi:hypothetical protein